METYTDSFMQVPSTVEEKQSTFVYVEKVLTVVYDPDPNALYPTCMISYNMSPADQHEQLRNLE